MAELRDAYVRTCTSLDKLRFDIPAIQTRISSTRSEAAHLSAQAVALEESIAKHSILAMIQGKPAQLEKLRL